MPLMITIVTLLRFSDLEPVSQKTREEIKQIRPLRKSAQ